ncbi:MAG: ABC transporter substrate-binding protein [Desulfovibrionales bacterium]|nr:ABC transporter substrate-binding protein [Desulfovibrionales bacterium]
MKNRSSILCLIMLIIVTIFYISPSTTIAAEPIRIGVYLPMTGPAAVYGQVAWKGLQMVHKDRPTVLGRPVQLILVDDKSDKMEAANAVSRLIEKERVTAIIGELTSSNTLSGSPIAEKARIPMVTPWATNPLVTQKRQYIFRVCFSDPFQGYVAAKFAREYLKARTAAVMIDISQDYSVGLSNFFMREFTKRGGRVVIKTAYQSGDLDFTAQLSSISGMRPDIIYVPGYFMEDALIARQARELGIRSIIVSGDAAQADELIKIGGKAVEGLYFTTHFDEKGATTKRGQLFVKKFHEINKAAPDSVSALSYDSYNFLLDAVERARSAHPEKIKDALSRTTNFEGVTGNIAIKGRETIKQAVMLKVENGGFRYITTIQPQ